MRKRIVMVAVTVLGCVILIVAGSAVFKLFSFSSSPKYQGHTVNYWLAEVFTTNQLAALAALRNAGPEAMPTLVNAYSRRDSGWYGFYRKLYPRLPVKWQQDLPRPVSAEMLWGAAGLVVLNNPNSRAAFPDLIRLLGDERTPSRSYVIGAVSYLIRAEDRAAVPVLIQCLKATNADVRSQAAAALPRIGPKAKDALPALTAAMSDPDLSVRVSAAQAVWTLDRQTNAAAAVLKAAMNSSPSNSPSDSRMRLIAAVYLSQIDPSDDSAIPVLIEMLRNPDPGLNNSAAVSLGNYGPAASAAVPALSEKMGKSDLNLRASALSALQRIDPATAAKYEQH